MTTSDRQQGERQHPPTRMQDIQTAVLLMVFSLVLDMWLVEQGYTVQEAHNLAGLLAVAALLTLVLRPLALTYDRIMEDWNAE